MTATAPETTERTTDPNRTMYWILGGIVVVLCVIGLITYQSGKNNAEAQQKAQQLTAKFRAAGLPVPADTDTLVRALGTDGGAVCDNPASALGKAILADQLTNGASFVGRRPVRIDRRFVLGEALILQTYCPEKAKEYQDQIKDLRTANTFKP
jgi:hypothetical protein